ncbi:caspase family protein [Litorivicinus sp.]|nr:caspase family protein [Litorivicinus sp.]
MNFHSLISVLAFAGILSGCASTMSDADFTQLPSHKQKAICLSQFQANRQFCNVGPCYTTGFVWRDPSSDGDPHHLIEGIYGIRRHVEDYCLDRTVWVGERIAGRELNELPWGTRRNLHSKRIWTAYTGSLSNAEVVSSVITKANLERSDLLSDQSSESTYRAHKDKADFDICYMIAENADPEGAYLAEAKFRGLTCSGRVDLSEGRRAERVAKTMKLETSVNVCLRALDVSRGWKNSGWSNEDRMAVEEASRRGFDVVYCRRLTASFQGRTTSFHAGKELPVGILSQSQAEISGTSAVSRQSSDQDIYRPHRSKTNRDICYMANEMGHRDTSYAVEANWRGLACGNQYLAGDPVGSNQPVVASAPAEPVDWSSLPEDVLCFNVGGPFASEISRELISRGLDCGLGDLTVFATREEPDADIDQAELKKLRDQLAKLRAETSKREKAIVEDDQKPTVRITNYSSTGVQGTISGVAQDNTGIAELLVGGRAVNIGKDGQFSTSVFIPAGGIDIDVIAYDLNGQSTTETIRLERSAKNQVVSRLEPVNPLVGPKQKPSRDRAALIIGLEKYAVAQPAQFASRDAQMFADYAREKLGIPAGNVKLLTDSRASERGILRALKVWLPTVVRPDETDLYVFYAGHGMPTADGSSAYLVPHDGDVQLLEDTAISRTRFFNEIEKARPRSATLFFDNCYSGATRSEELLLASRPLGIKVQETDVPDNYLVFTAGESNQTAGVLDEVKHGRFSYFVFKGLEGEADANSDGKISAGELHRYVRESVGRFSAGAQTPTMLGDSSRWVLR